MKITISMRFFGFVDPFANLFGFYHIPTLPLSHSVRYIFPGEPAHSKAKSITKPHSNHTVITRETLPQEKRKHNGGQITSTTLIPQTLHLLALPGGCPPYLPGGCFLLNGCKKKSMKAPGARTIGASLQASFHTISVWKKIFTEIPLYSSIPRPFALLLWNSSQKGARYCVLFQASARVYLRLAPACLPCPALARAVCRTDTLLLPSIHFFPLSFLFFSACLLRAPTWYPTKTPRCDLVLPLPPTPKLLFPDFGITLCVA